MKCKYCPLQWVESNESTYPPMTGCMIDPEDERCYELEDGSLGCDISDEEAEKELKRCLDNVGV